MKEVKRTYVKAGVFVATLVFLSFSVACVSAEEVQIRIEGGIGYRASVYNPYNTSFNATFNVTTLYTHIPIESTKWTTIPHLWIGPVTRVISFTFISAKVIALDKTATRNGVIIGPFVIFGEQINT
jgi:hypothetical protein